MSVTFFVEGQDEGAFNISNHNFYKLCAVIGLNSAPCGQIDPADLDNRLEYLTGTLKHDAPLPLSIEQIVNYFCGLQGLVFLAQIAGKKINWG